MLIAALLAAPAGAQDKPTATAPATSAAASRAVALEPAAVRFEVVDVYVDTKDKPLAAYQFTLHAGGAEVRLVSLEGGDHPAFAAPPFYDKKALMTERVIVAAFSTNAELPSGRVRVCRLHVQVTGNAAVHYTADLQAAADAAGSAIDAQVSVSVAGS